jgi:hypothetical protein
MARIRKMLGPGDITVEHESEGVRGRPCVAVTFESLGDLKLRFCLQDAESLGEALIKIVRQAEEAAEH